MNPCPNNSSYRAGCKCDACKAKVAKYMSDYRRRKAEKKWGATHDSDLMSPERCEKLIWDAYSVRGMTLAEITRVCGINKQTTSAIFNQQREHVTREIHDRIVAGLERGYTMRHREPTTLVDAYKYTWMIWCLHAQGWRETDLMEMLRAGGRNSGFIRHAKNNPQIQWRNAQSILWLAEKIGDRHGPSKQTAAMMRKRGIYPLIHYTEDGELIESSIPQPGRTRRK